MCCTPCTAGLTQLPVVTSRTARPEMRQGEGAEGIRGVQYQTIDRPTSRTFNESNSSAIYIGVDKIMAQQIEFV